MGCPSSKIFPSLDSNSHINHKRKPLRNDIREKNVHGQKREETLTKDRKAKKPGPFSRLFGNKKTPKSLSGPWIKHESPDHARNDGPSKPKTKKSFGLPSFKRGKSSEQKNKRAPQFYVDTESSLATTSGSLNHQVASDNRSPPAAPANLKVVTDNRSPHVAPTDRKARTDNRSPTASRTGHKVEADARSHTTSPEVHSREATSLSPSTAPFDHRLQAENRAPVGPIALIRKTESPSPAVDLTIHKTGAESQFPPVRPTDLMAKAKGHQLAQEKRGSTNKEDNEHPAKKPLVFGESLILKNRRSPVQKPQPGGFLGKVKHPEQNAQSYQPLKTTKLPAQGTQHKQSSLLDKDKPTFREAQSSPSQNAKPLLRKTRSSPTQKGGSPSKDPDSGLLKQSKTRVQKTQSESGLTVKKLQQVIGSSQNCLTPVQKTEPGGLLHLKTEGKASIQTREPNSGSVKLTKGMPPLLKKPSIPLPHQTSSKVPVQVTESSQGSVSSVKGNLPSQEPMDQDEPNKGYSANQASGRKINELPKENEEPKKEKIINVLRTAYEQKTRLQEPQFLLESHSRSDRGQMEVKFLTPSQLLPAPREWKMLVYGKPFFGKTELCRCLASNWALNDRNPFAILYFHILKENNTSTLEEDILEACFGMVDKGGGGLKSLEELKGVWAGQMTKTLIILDGYDRLDKERKILVKRFIVDKGFFGKACVLVTSTPDCGIEFSRLFTIQADICGLTEITLSKLKGKNVKQDLQTIIRQCKVQELYGLSPLYTQAICEAIQKETPKSLYELLYLTISLLAKREGLDTITMMDIGKFMLECLKERKFVFQQNTIMDLVRHKWESVQKLNVFVPVHIGVSDTLMASVHLNFMVYFAVRYLREVFLKLTTTEEKLVYLKTQFCYPDCSLEYVKEQGGSSKQYYAGLIPEIVYDINSGLFEMIQDVQCSALQSAFRTPSLLFRLDRKRLPAYRIVEVKDPLLEETFEAVLNILDFDSLTIYRKFYVTRGCDLPFLKFCAVDEDSNKVIIMSVVSVNPKDENRVQEIYLDFKIKSVQEIWPFLVKVSEMFFDSSHIDASMSGPEMIHGLMMSALECKLHLFTQLSLGSNILDRLCLFTAEVITSVKNCQTLSLSYAENEQTICQKFDSSLFSNSLNDGTILNRIKNSVAGEEDLAVTMCIKTRFSEKTPKRSQTSTKSHAFRKKTKR